MRGCSGLPNRSESSAFLNVIKIRLRIEKTDVVSDGTGKLYVTGNTYVLVSKENAIMVFDPWGKRSVEQVQKLRQDKNLGPIELVMFSHAHYDHFDGIHVLNGRDRCEVWSLDLVAIPLKDPLAVRASKKLRNDELLVTALAGTRLLGDGANLRICRGVVREDFLLQVRIAQEADRKSVV